MNGLLFYKNSKLRKMEEEKEDSGETGFEEVGAKPFRPTTIASTNQDFPCLGMENRQPIN